MTMHRDPNDAGGAVDHADRPGRATDPDAQEERPLGISLLIWLYWFWTGAVALVLLVFAVGDGPVPISGQTIPRDEALARASRSSAAPSPSGSDDPGPGRPSSCPSCWPASDPRSAEWAPRRPTWSSGS